MSTPLPGLKTPPVKPGWKLTFEDDFDRPQLNDMYWYPAYRSGRKEYFRRLGVPSRWVDHNAHVVIENSILKLRLGDQLPFRPEPAHPCVSCITTSDHRFGPTTDSFQVMEKFSQKYGWFEIRARCPRGSGLLSAFWLHQCDPTRQEYTPDGRRKDLSAGAVEIDIIELQGRHNAAAGNDVNLNVHFTEKGHYLHHNDFDAAAGFHVWAMEWEEGRIEWSCDGVRMEEYIGPTPPEKMFILLALFQYSGWIGDIDPAMAYPKDFEIDYVRVYQRENNVTP